MDQELVDLINSLQAKRLALLFYGRREEFLKFMNDAFDSTDILEDQVIEEFKKTCRNIAIVEKKIELQKVQLISFAP